MFVTERFFEWLLTEPAVSASIHGMDLGEYAVLLGAKTDGENLLERSLLGIPVWANNKLTGLLGVLVQQLDAPKDELSEISRVLGEIVGISLDRATAFSEPSQEPHSKSLTRLMARQRMLSAANMRAQEEVRRQLAEDLHDTTSEIASAISLGLKSLSMMLEETATAEQTACILRLQELSKMLTREQKAIFDGLDPVALRTQGIGVAVRAQARHEADMAGFELRFVEQGMRRRLVHDVELAIYRISCEAVANVAKHAQAQTLDVSITWSDTSLVVEIRDDGCGFDVANSEAMLYADDHDDTLFGFHRGLGNMRNRAYAAGISLDITSELGEGTRVCMEVPLTWQVLTDE